MHQAVVAKVSQLISLLSSQIFHTTSMKFCKGLQNLGNASFDSLQTASLTIPESMPRRLYLSTHPTRILHGNSFELEAIVCGEDVLACPPHKLLYFAWVVQFPNQVLELTTLLWVWHLTPISLTPLFHQPIACYFIPIAHRKSPILGPRPG